MEKSKKKEMLKELQAKLQDAQIVIVGDYKGLDVASLTDLRRQLKEEDSEFKVVKNTLFKLAAQDSSFDLLKDEFEGANGVMFAYKDAVSPTKILVNFAKKNKKLNIKKAILNEQVLEADQIVQLSKMPSREVLLGQFVSLLNAVPTSFVRALAEVPSSFVRTLGQIRDQKSQN